MADIIGSGNKQDKWTIRATELLNWLNDNKQAVLVAGDNITLTPQQDGTVEISASGGGEGTVTDVLVDGVSVVNQAGEAEIMMPSVPTDLEDLDNVNPTSPADGQALIYDGTNQEWINGNVSGSVDDVVMNGQSIVDANKVASFQNYVELTQAEYDALPASKLTDGILYCIKDTGIVEGEKFAPVIYSLEEREIGVWTDGKPLYEITKTGTLSNTQTTVVFDLIENNVDNVIDCKGKIGWINVYGDTAERGLGGYENANSYSDWGINASGTNLFIQHGTFMLNQPYVITIYYTKTTDTPGSGKWGTDGVPAWKNYHANWIATSSNASGTNLTEEVTVPAGKCLVICHTPVSNASASVLNSNYQFGLKINGTLDVTTLAVANIQYGRFECYLELAQQSTLALCSAISTSVSWDSNYLNRGGMDILF